MCRLVAYLGGETSVAPLVFGGEHSLLRQSWAPRELLSGSVNADGWGVAWYADGRPRRLAEARPIWYEQELETTLSALRSHSVVAALRNGTPGLTVDRTALLPMVLGPWTFVLNGFVPDFHERHMRALRADLPDALYAQLRGASDSETLFLRTVAAMEAGAGPLAALVSVVRDVLERLNGSEEEAQLTLLLADGQGIHVVRTSNVDTTNSLYLSEGSALGSGGWILASEPLTEGERWEPVPPHHAVRLDGSGMSVRPLDAP